MFSFDPSFDVSLIPHNDNWPIFDEVVMFSPLSPSSSLTSPSPSPHSDPLPSSAALADMPIPPSRASPRNKNPNHIPRPRNAFMLFRSAFAAAQKVSVSVENDNRHITRIIAHCWNRLSEAEKQIWRDKAAAEKTQHAQRYPNYRFRPVGRAKKPKKRKVRRNGAEDVKRCETVANLVMAGNYGRELERAWNRIQAERPATECPLHAVLDAFSSGETRGTLFDLDPSTQDPSTDDIPPFRSPLLPPVETSPEQVADENLIPQPLVIATAPHVEPQTFHSPTCSDASTRHGDLQTLFHSPCYQFQPDLRNDVSPSGSIPLTHYQPVMTFVQDTRSNRAETEPPIPDFSLFSWNQSDSFPYYH